MHGGRDKLSEAAPPLASATISWRHRLIILIIGSILALPAGIVFLKNRSFLPLLLFYATLLAFILWLIYRYEIIFLRRGASEHFFSFYSLHEFLREEADLPRLAEKICQGLADWLKCRKVYFYLVDEALGKWQAIARFDPSGWGEDSIPKDAPIVGLLVSSQSALLLPPDSNLGAELGFRVLVPLRARERLVGFIACGEKEGGEPYYRVELMNLDLLATQIGLFLEKEDYRRTLRRQVRELTSAQEILSRMLANPYHLDSVLESLVGSLRLLYPKVRLVEICLWDERERKMVAHKVSGTGIREGHKYDLGEGLSGIIARDRRSILIRDYQALEEKPAELAGVLFRSFVGVPLLHQGKLIGSLEMDSLYPDAFNEEDLRFLEGLAPYFAAIIHNVRTYHSQAMEKEALLEAYSVIGKLLASGLRGEELLSYTAGVIRTLMDADACAVRILKGKGSGAIASYWAGSESIVPPPKWEVEICSRQDEVMIPQLERPGAFSDSRGMKAFMAASFYLRGEKLGWIGVWRREQRGFSEAEMGLLKAFSAQVAAVWERVALQEELEKTNLEMEFLKDFGELVAGVSFEELARKSFEAITRKFGLTGTPCCLSLFVSGPEEGPAIAMTPAFNPYLAEILAFLAPAHPVEPEAIIGLRGYFRGFEVLPIEFVGKVWGVFLAPEGKTPELTLPLHHIGARTAWLFLNGKLEEIQGKFIKLLGSAADGFYLVDKSGGILDLDEKLCALTGFARGDIVGQNCRSLYPDETVPLAVRAGWAEDLAVHETHVKARDGHLVPVREVVIPISPEKAAVAIWDLSREKELEKVQDVITIFLVHEIGRLVTRLSTGLYLYREGRRRKETLDELVGLTDKLTEAVRKLQEMVNFERGKIRLNLVSLDVARLAREIVDRFAEGGTHRFSFEGPEGPSLALADEKMVEITLSNLLDNAVKYSPSGSLITVKVESEGDEVKVSVRDEGYGIPIPLQRKIFEKFYRIETKEAARASGLGLGLYFCKLIVEAHGGRIWVESAPGCGSTFSFTLPKVMQT